MTDLSAALLPEGFRDRLPPQAEAAAGVLRRVLDTVAGHGYERVEPPLVEFEESLVGRLGKDRARALLRVTDPATGRTLALRPDMTGQVGRIAATRLAGEPRPLRLSYGGRVLRVRGGALDPARELTQAGAELIGADSVAAVAEVLRLAVEALEATGMSGLGVDLTLPDLVPELAAGAWTVGEHDLPMLLRLLDAKDAAALCAHGFERFEALAAAAGPLDTALARLRALGLPASVGSLLDAAEAVARSVGDVPVTLDPADRQGFEFQSWIGFTLYARDARGEVGRGGAYAVVHPGGRAEPAVGFSLYVDTLVDAGAGLAEPGRPRVLLPPGTDPAAAAALRAEGWATVADLDGRGEPAAFRCTHRWNGVEAVPA